MYRTLLPALVAFALTLATPNLVKAADATQDATVMTYRADETPSTDRQTCGLRVLGNQLQAKMLEVEEQVARSQGADTFRGTI